MTASKDTCQMHNGNFLSFTLQGYYGIGSVCMEPMTDVWEDSLAR